MLYEEKWWEKLIELFLLSILVAGFFFCLTTLIYVFFVQNIAVMALRYGVIAGLISGILALPTLFVLKKHGYLP